jgi:3-dehydroquinate dehydratase type I
MTELTQPPLVVGSIGPAGLAALAAVPASERVADIVEARLDLAAAAVDAADNDNKVLPDLRRFFDPCRRLEETGTPVLATIRLTADGGRWTVDGKRLSCFQDVLDVASWVDIEVQSEIAKQVVAYAHARGRHVIVSHHDLEGTPPIDVLEEIATRARALGADVVKIATLVKSLDDHDCLLDLLRRQRVEVERPLALIAMGPVGTSLRTYLPCVGSRLTYGYFDQIVAPGQLSARELVQRLIADCPVYAAHRRLREAG